MTFLGNLLWLLCGGLFSALGWFGSGLLWCLTVVGIPWGLQCFKFAKLSLAPFGKEVIPGGGAPSLIANVIWLLISGIVGFVAACIAAYLERSMITVALIACAAVFVTEQIIRWVG